jgi:hypothetical protein
MDRAHRWMFVAALVLLQGCALVSDNFDAEVYVNFHIDDRSSFESVSPVDPSNPRFHDVKDVALENAAISVACLDDGNESTRLDAIRVALRPDGGPADGSLDVIVAGGAGPLSSRITCPSPRAAA